MSMSWIVVVGFLSSFVSVQCLNGACHAAFYNAPTCIDQPVGYYCNCGPGFRWNSKQCIAAGVDSKMIFQSLNSSFAVLERLMLPKEFSLSLWVRPRSAGVLVSLVNMEGNTSQLTLSLIHGYRNKFTPNIRYISDEWSITKPLDMNRWTHIIWAQQVLDSRTIKWISYINGKHDSKILFKSSRILKGELILGQLSKALKGGLNDHGFSGEISHVNIWNYSLSEEEMGLVHKDCIYQYCGNVAQWSDFRLGTRGHLHLKWPSGLTTKHCVDTNELIRSCDLSCSRHIGAQCKVEIKANIEWERTKANTSISSPCPMPIHWHGMAPSINQSAFSDPRPTITRFCEETISKEGRWKEPNIDSCISDEWAVLLRKKKELHDMVGLCTLSDADLIEGLTLFANLTERLAIVNAIDLSLCVDILDSFTLLKEKLESKCPRFTIEISQKREEVHQNQYTIIKLVMRIANNLMDNKNSYSWNYTRPSGFEGRKLLGVLNKFYQITAENINNIINKHFYMPREMALLINDPNIVFKLTASRWSDFRGEAFPNFDDISEISETQEAHTHEIATVALSNNFLIDRDPSQISLYPNYVVIIAAIYRNAAVKASFTSREEHMRMRTGAMPQMSQRINADIVDIAVAVDGRRVEKIQTKSMKIHFMYKEFFNISNTQCLSMAGDFRKSNIYSANRSSWYNDCDILESKPDSVVCICDKLGVFAVSSDMFNDMWKKKKLPNNLLALPSYFGCSVSALLCSVSLIMLVYLRTVSITSSIHKHFSMAIIAGQMSYMFGIDKYEHKITCRIFSLLLHYFFLSCFTWLMNEAFNLYIVITYAAHSHGDNTDGHMWRFYLLGWIMPAILVAAVAGINKENYYAKNVCWINKKDVWLFYGPAIAIISVSILVLIFTAKEHHESSYTKNEKDNKAIINQTKAIWTQVILLTISWSFAFICVRMQGIIVKYLFGLFNSLQGAFYIVFYYLLNDEVQNIYSDGKNEERKRKASEQGDTSLHDIPYICYNDAYPDNDHHLDLNRNQESSLTGNVTDKRRSFFSNVIENLNIRSKRSQNKRDADQRGGNDNSDYELITSV